MNFTEFPHPRGSLFSRRRSVHATQGQAFVLNNKMRQWFTQETMFTVGKVNILQKAPFPLSWKFLMYDNYFREVKTHWCCTQSSYLSILPSNRQNFKLFVQDLKIHGFAFYFIFKEILLFIKVVTNLFLNLN